MELVKPAMPLREMSKTLRLLLLISVIAPVVLSNSKAMLQLLKNEVGVTKEACETTPAPSLARVR